MTNTYPHLTPRQKAREMAFQFLFQLDQEKSFPSPSDIEKLFTKHAEHFNCPPQAQEFADRLVRTTATNIQAIDAMMTKHAQNWRIERFGAVDKAFLRIGVAELLYFKDVPASVTLNELVELSKHFGEEETPSFLNGILDPVSKEPEAMAGKVPSE